jgi:hypothetical protein
MAAMALLNMEKAAENVHKAQCEKIFLRAKFCVDDAIQLMKKYEIFERFQNKE